MEVTESSAAEVADAWTVSLTPIGVVRSPRTDPTDDHWGNVVSRIELDPNRFSADSLRGLDDFSHAEVVFLFHRVPESSVERGARHPRENTAWPEVGIFAQRAKDRPNRLAVSRCRVLGVEGLSLTVAELDAIDGSPVLDVKPYVKEMGPRGEVRQPAWMSELMRNYYAPADPRQ